MLSFLRCHWLLGHYTLAQPHACHSSTDHISCPLNPKLYSYTQDAFRKTVLTRMSGLKKGDHYCARVHQHHHVQVCVYTFLFIFKHHTVHTVGFFLLFAYAITSVFLFMYCVHSSCIVFILCVIVCVCELLSAFQPHLNPSILQLETDEGAQGKSSRHVSLLYLHSLAVFVSYISSNERKIKKINNTLFVSFSYPCSFAGSCVCPPSG